VLSLNFRASQKLMGHPIIQVAELGLRSLFVYGVFFVRMLEVFKI